MIQRMKKQLDEQEKLRKAAYAQQHARLFLIVGTLLLFASWLAATSGDLPDAGGLCIGGIIALAVSGLFTCRYAWLTTPPPEEPNI